MYKCDNCGREMEIAATGQCPFCEEGNIVKISIDSDYLTLMPNDKFTVIHCGICGAEIKELEDGTIQTCSHIGTQAIEMIGGENMVNCWFDESEECIFEERPQESGWCLACSKINKEADRVFAIAKEQMNMLKDIMAFVGQAAAESQAQKPQKTEKGSTIEKIGPGKKVKICNACSNDNDFLAVYCDRCGNELYGPYPMD